jgi:energy-coupling factor transporter ATP-binding protein EcfA2
MLGHERIVEDFIRLEERGKLGHAYLFFGPRGVGKTTFAKYFAEYLETKEWPKEEGVRALTDMMFVAPDEVGTIGIAAARAIKYFLSERPLVSSRRTVIISEAGALTTEAQNALLKVAEEPPATGLLFFALQDPELLMPTLVSRMQNVYFTPVQEKEISSWLQKQKIPKAEADAAAAEAHGKPGLAWRTASGETLPNEESAREFLRTGPAARKEFVKALVEPEDFSFRGFLDGMITVLAGERKRNSALWHAVLELRSMADATGLNPRLQIMYLGTLL